MNAAPHRQVSVVRLVGATPEQLYRLVTDLPRMGEWSPENEGGKWLKGATTAAVGATFKGKNRKGWQRWSTLATVVSADQDRLFAFDVTSAGLKVARWSYALRPVEGGTEITESWEDQRSPLIGKITGVLLRVPDRGAHNRAGMEQTLERLSVAATTG